MKISNCHVAPSLLLLFRSADGFSPTTGSGLIAKSSSFGVLPHYRGSKLAFQKLSQGGDDKSSSDSFFQHQDRLVSSLSSCSSSSPCDNSLQWLTTTTTAPSTTPASAAAASATALAVIITSLGTWAALPSDADAAASASVVPAALWSYGHYLAQLLVMGSLVAERVVIKPGMSPQEEKTLNIANVVYGVSLALLLITGGIRTADFGKGFSFYSQEILFWLKMSFSGILIGCALFPSIILFRRGSNSNPPPMSDKLAARMTTIINAEISGLLTIPLVATFMARGVTYWNDFPWQAGLVFAVLTSGGASYFYGKQALTWTEDVKEETEEQDV